MEAVQTNENIQQEMKKQEIKVEDFFINDQQNNPNENDQNAIEINEKKFDDFSNIKIESENVKSKKII